MLLTIVKFPEKGAFSEAARTIDASGSTIGRAKSNDWVLDDPERFLSSRHAQISVDDGVYYLTDLSTNGTFVNGEDEPLGKGNRSPLKDGDRIVMGEYEFEVSLWSPDIATDDPFGAGTPPQPGVPAEDATPSSGFGGTEAGEPWPDPGRCASAPPAPSIAEAGGQGGLSGLLDPGGEVLDPLEALDRAGQPGEGAGLPVSPWDDVPDPWSTPAELGETSGYGSTSEHVSMHAQSMRLPQAIPEDWDLDEQPVSEPHPGRNEITPARRPVEPFSEMTPPPPPAETADVPTDTAPTHRRQNPMAPGGMGAEPPETGIASPAMTGGQPMKQAPVKLAEANESGVGAALFAALGIDAQRLTATEQRAVATVTGEFLREAIAGLIRVLGSRSSIKNEFRMSVTTIQPVENNPLKFSATVDDAIELMFVKRAKAYKPPLEAVREGFDGIADHQIAVIAGMRAAFESIIRRFDPEQLQQRFERQQKAGLIPASKKARYWDAYQVLYEDLTRDSDEAFQLLFGDDFVQSYESQLTRLAVARKRGSGDRND